MLDQLANALRGMPRNAPMLVATADGLCPIVQVRTGRLKRNDSTGHGGVETVYAITLQLGEPISRQAGQPASASPRGACSSNGWQGVILGATQASNTGNRNVAELPDIQIEVERDPSGALAAMIEGRLNEALRQNVPPNDSELFILLARGGTGTTIVGGLVGSTSYGWLLVRMLWVAEEMRCRGLGGRLMAQAEALARAKGCHGAWLDTSSRDAERFYGRLGYKPFGTLENLEGECPHGHRRVFLAKRFAEHRDAPSQFS